MLTILNITAAAMVFFIACFTVSSALEVEEIDRQ